MLLLGDFMKTQSLLAVLLTIASVTATSHASTELLYVQSGHDLVSYSVNSKTAAATKLAVLKLPSSTKYKTQIFHAPTSAYVYVLGFTSASEEYFWVYDTTSSGAVSKLVQTLSVKPDLTQFRFLPNGDFGYGFFASTADGGKEHVADIALFSIDTKTGKLTEKKVVASFPANRDWLTSLNGLIGSKLYIQSYSDVGSAAPGTTDYYYYTINSKTGLLGAKVYFWEDNVDIGENSSTTTASTFSSSLIASALTNGYAGEAGNAIGFWPNDANALNDEPWIYCLSTMVAACGDFPGLEFDPSGKYLFLDVSTVHETVIAAINTKDNKLKETGSIAGAYKVAFSPDGRMFYGAGENEVLVYVFDPTGGEVTAKSSISVSDVQSVTPFD
jgi:hypothetical protein